MNFNDRLIQGYDLAKKIPDLHGHAKIDFLRGGKIVHRVEHDNTITPWIANAIGKGNFHDQINPSKIMPIKQWFEGCLLTDGVNDPELSMLAGDVNVTAQASNDAYSGDNQKRGSYNATESGVIENGFRFVWDWATNQGNGSIASVCLTRGDLAKIQIKDGALDDNIEVNPLLNNTTYTGGYFRFKKSFDVIDYANNKAYFFSVSSSKITSVTVMTLSSSKLHIMDQNYLDVSTSNTITLDISLSGNGNYPSFWLDSSGIHVNTLQQISGGTRVFDYLFDPSDWSVTTSQYDFTGIWATVFNTKGYGRIMHDDDYIWLFGGDSTGAAIIAKCNKSNVADVVAYPNPCSTYYGYVAQNDEQQGSFVKLPNGHWIRFPRAQQSYGVYFNTNQGKGYPVYNNGWTHVRQYWITNEGTLLTGQSNHLNDPSATMEMYIQALFPYVSTVNNLDSAVTKTADLTMKLTYEITEV